VAAAVEDSTRIDDHAWRVNLSRHHAFGFDLHAALRENHAIEAARDYDAVSLDLSFNLSAFAKDDGLFRNDVAFYVTVDAKRAFYRQRALERYALVDESCPFLAGAILRTCGPLPCHFKTPI